MNKYAVTKSIRFKLKRLRLAEEFGAKAHVREATGEEIRSLVERLRKIKADCTDIFFAKIRYGTHDESERKPVEGVDFYSQFEIRYGWLRNYTKADFYDWKERKTISEERSENQPKRYTLSDVDYLSQEFVRWVNEWDTLCEQLEGFLNQPDDKLKRRNEYAFVLRSLQKRTVFEFIREFVGAIHATNDPKTDDAVVRLLSDIRETETLLAECEAIFLPSQSVGLRIAKATFNYYTLNKTPKMYDEEILRERQILNRSISTFRYKDGTSRYRALASILPDHSIMNQSLDQAYEIIKKWKSEQKNGFLEAAQKKTLTYTDYIAKFPLFEAKEEDFNVFLDRTEEIETLATRRNIETNLELKREMSERLKELKKVRSHFFKSPDHLDAKKPQIIETPNYSELCELYKQIAMERGRSLNRIRSAEREREESQRLQYLSLILEEDGRHYLVLIPRGSGENHKHAKEYIGRMPRTSEAGVTLYHFESLTLRALWKLCFKGERNTFFPKVAEELALDRKKSEETMIRGKKHLLQANFYQDVLKTRVARSAIGGVVDFGGLSAVLERSYECLEDFESDLERTCYVKVAKKMSRAEKDDFITQFDASVLEISSYDLRIEQEDRKEVVERHQEKAHTVKWRKFWEPTNENNGFPIRINPEVSIFWREPLYDLEDKIGYAETIDGNMHKTVVNRFSQEQFTLQTTISVNATEKKSNLMFKTTAEIADSIERFNRNFERDFQGQWIYGIDRGQGQLATLCIARFSNEKNEFGISRFEGFGSIVAWRLKDERYEEEVIRADGTKFLRKAINNVSYFIDREELFEPVESACLDLTAAKLVKGKIVINGDRQTYMKLKILAAKRRIWELRSLGKISFDSHIEYLCAGGKDSADWRNAYGVMIVKSDGGKEDLYWFTDSQLHDENLKKEVVDILNGYLATLHERNAVEDIESLEKVNHLRDSITANMVGIIAHLQSTYPGILALENMDSKEHVGRQFLQTNQNISRRLEWALYRKFQEACLVPPQVKQSIFLREDFSVHQFGIMKFVKIEETSRSCPRCGAINRKKPRGRDLHYACSKCGFDSETTRGEFEPLTDSDRVAAYNIAKNAFDNLFTK